MWTARCGYLPLALSQKNHILRCCTLSHDMSLSFAELQHVNAVQAHDLYVKFSENRGFLKCLTWRIWQEPYPPLCYSVCNPIWPFAVIVDTYLIYTPGNSLKSKNKHGFPIVLLLYLLKKLFSQQKKMKMPLERVWALIWIYSKETLKLHGLWTNCMPKWAVDLFLRVPIF